MDALTIGDKTQKIKKDTVIDSGLLSLILVCRPGSSMLALPTNTAHAGTTFSYLTVDAFKWLNETLGGRYSPRDPNMLYPAEQGNEMMKFNFESFSVARRLSDMLDPRPNASD